MRIALLVILAGLALAAIACDGDSVESTVIPSPPASPEATAGASPSPPAAVSPTAETPPAAATPSPQPVTCAADSTDEFAEAQAGSDFAMYCPTLLPEGLALRELRFTAPDATPAMDAPPPGELNAAFLSADSETQVVLYEGRLGASFVASIVELAADEGVAPVPVAYGDLEGDLYAPLTTITDVALGAFVIVSLPDGTSHVLHTAEVDVPTVRYIAAAMRSVSP